MQWWKQWSWKYTEFVTLLDSTDTQILEFYINYANSFSIETGALFARVKEMEADMSPSETILLNRKLSEIHDTIKYIAYQRSMEAQRNAGKR